MKTCTFLLFFVYIINGCTNNYSASQSTLVNDTVVNSKIDSKELSDIHVDWKDIEVMDDKDIKYQGQISRYFSVRDLEIFGKIDSTQSIFLDPPCNDGNFWYKHDSNLSKEEFEKINKYIFINGSKFEQYADSVAIENFKFLNGNFVLYKDVRLDNHSTIADFKKLFPNAVMALGSILVYGEGELEYIVLKEEPNNISDGHIRIFFKKGLLYMMHHWFPC